MSLINSIGLDRKVIYRLSNVLGGRSEVLETPVEEALDYMILLREEDEENYNKQVDDDIKLFQIIKHSVMTTQPVSENGQRMEINNEINTFIDTLHQYVGVRGLMQAEQKMAKFKWSHEE